MDHKILPPLSGGSLRPMFIVGLLVGLGYIPATSAAHPLTIDPEIGANDLRLSDMGPNGDVNYGAYYPAVAYNSTDNEYLVVWSGDDNTAPLVEGEDEIFGQRVDGATGAELGTDFRLSDMGPAGYRASDARSPAVAYNSTNNEYLVVWSGDDLRGGRFCDGYEIHGQRVNAATGAQIGTDFRLSNMGPDGHPHYEAFHPAVAYNSTNNEYLVVWHGDDNTGELVDGEFEIYGQRLDGVTGAQIGTDFRLSDMGADGDVTYSAYIPAVVYNSTNNEYLVVWYGDDNTGELMDEEFEIYGQRVDGATGAQIGTDFRLSDVGPDGNDAYDAWSPAVAYNPTGDEYLVVWHGDDSTDGLIDDEFEIFGQRFTTN